MLHLPACELPPEMLPVKMLVNQSNRVDHMLFTKPVAARTAFHVYMALEPAAVQTHAGIMMPALS